MILKTEKNKRTETMNSQYEITDESTQLENEINFELPHVENEDYFVWDEDLKCFQESKKYNIQENSESSERNYDIYADLPIQDVEEGIPPFQVSEFSYPDDQHNNCVDLPQSLDQTNYYNQNDFSPSEDIQKIKSNKSCLLIDKDLEDKEKTNANYCEIHKSVHFVDVMKSARDLYTKKTRTLMHWINPEIQKSVITTNVHAAWENLPDSQKQIYVSQVVGKFAPEISTTPIINPELLSFNSDTYEINSNDKLFRTRTYKPKNIVKSDKKIKTNRVATKRKTSKNIERVKKPRQKKLKVQDETKSLWYTSEPRQCLSYWGNQGSDYYNFDDAVLIDL